MKRGAWIALGVVLLPVGLCLVGGGAATAAVMGSSDAISTAPTRLHGAGAALVAEDVSIDRGNVPIPSSLGHLTLRVSAPDSRTVFVGAGAPASVDTYLTGVPYDVVVDVTAGGTGRTRAVPGNQKASVPTSQNFWAAQATGAPARLTGDVPASATLVVMNADASRGVTVDVVVTLAVPGAWRAAWVAIGVGALAIVLAVLAFWRAKVAGRRQRAAELPGAADLAASPAAVPVGASPSMVVAAEGLAEDHAGSPPTVIGEAAIDVAPPLDVTAPIDVAELEVALADGVPVDEIPLASTALPAPDPADEASDELDLEAVGDDPAYDDLAEDLAPDQDRTDEGAAHEDQPDEGAADEEQADEDATDPVYAALSSSFGLTDAESPAAEAVAADADGPHGQQ